MFSSLLAHQIGCAALLVNAPQLQLQLAMVKTIVAPALLMQAVACLCNFAQVLLQGHVTATSMLLHVSCTNAGKWHACLILWTHWRAAYCDWLVRLTCIRYACSAILAHAFQAVMALRLSKGKT